MRYVEAGEEINVLFCRKLPFFFRMVCVCVYVCFEFSGTLIEPVKLYQNYTSGQKESETLRRAIVIISRLKSVIIFIMAIISDLF